MDPSQHDNAFRVNLLYRNRRTDTLHQGENSKPMAIAKQRESLTEEEISFRCVGYRARHLNTINDITVSSPGHWT